MQASVYGPAVAAGAGDGGLPRPRGGESGRTGWTVDGGPNAVQGWTVNELPSRVGWFLAVRSGLGGPDTLQEKFSGKEFIRKLPANLFFLS